MKRHILILLILFSFPSLIFSQTTRKERRYVNQGNKFYKEGKFNEASKEYQLALSLNPSFTAAKYNLALSQLRMSALPDTPEDQKEQLLKEGVAGMTDVSSIGASDPKLADKAFYNLGNVSFNSQQYKEAIDYYKMALRFNPDDDSARRNLRIAQKKLEQNNQNNQNQDQNQDQKENQDKDKNQNQQQDQNKDQKEQEKQQQNSLSDRTMEQILKANENRENATRAKMNASNKGKESAGRGKNPRNW